MIEKGRQIPPKPGKIAIVGEAYGANEQIQGRPFVGYSGRLLTNLLRQAGITREDCYITNVVNKKPKGNHFSAFSVEEIEEGKRQLKEDLEEWQKKGLNIVIALGNTALEALTGYSNVMKYRGTILQSSIVKGLKVIPTIHPAFLIRGQTACNPVVIADFRKAKKEGEYPEFIMLEKHIEVIRNPKNAIAFLESVSDIDKPVTCDIETPIRKGKKPLLAYGIATSETDAFVLTREVLRIPAVIRALARFSKSGTKKIFHNANFDVFNMAYSYGIVTKNVEDTMIMQHDCYPSLPSILKPKSLAFCASMYANEPYWKDEMKGGDLYIYNGKDVCLTYQVYNALQKEMDTWGVREVYEHDMALFEPLLTMELKGVNIDYKALKEIKERNEIIIEKLERIKDATIGDVNIKSPKQMNELLYKSWKFDTVMKDGKVTTDKKVLDKLERMDTPYQPLFGLIRTLKKHYTMRGFYNLSFDSDGRMRTGFKIGGTVTGRLSSAELAGIGVGRNLQNIPKQLRKIYIPDEGKIFINADLSQAEARVVAAICGDKEWVEEFQREDTYKRIASFLFDVDKDKVSKDQRQVAKKVTHACNYGESWRGLSEVLRCPAADAKRLMNKLYKFRPFLNKWHLEIERDIKQKRILRSDYGRILQFFGNIAQKDIRTGLSFKPQGIVADYLNRGIVDLYKKIPNIDLLIQVHDSILFQTEDDYENVKRITEKTKEIIERPINVNGFEFKIPCDIEMGMNWYDMVEIDDFDGVWEEVHK